MIKKGRKSARTVIEANHGNGAKSVLDSNKEAWTKRILIGTPMTGLLRAEWVFARYGQTIPTNWSNVDVSQFMNSWIPLRYQIPDAENLLAKVVVEQDFEWFLSIEHDNVIPQDLFIKINQYMLSKKYPVVAGLYFTKSDPPEPMIYRHSGWGYYTDWKMGDKVWAAGVPFGCTLIHGSIIKALWKESEEYQVNGVTTRRVFAAPNEAWKIPNSESYARNVGTSDLAFCKRVIKDKIFEKAGWPKFQKMKYPYLVDTSIFVKHIDNNGVMWPLEVPKQFLK